MGIIMGVKNLKPQGNYVFGLDIGTRSIVGTVGYKDGDIFHIVAQDALEHQTRAMLDGQIHDISVVGESIIKIKNSLESLCGIELKHVCIAAAGRVLRTVEINATLEFDTEKEIINEDIASLTSLGIEKAYSSFDEENNSDEKFYCVGNSVIRYYMNGYQIGNLINHKAKNIGLDLIATFLPVDVVDSLNKAVEIAGLEVINMTLEPIAAIAVAIPEQYRMLNIALVDVGAGTSDICITKDGCIIAYGMIPEAGDKLTEIIAQACLVDFNTAEEIKIGISEKDTVEYYDIMGLPQTITKESVLEMLDEAVEDMTHKVSDKIKELNADKSVSAVFVVGGGGKIEGYTEKLAKYLQIIPQRVALRGKDVMSKIDFMNDNSDSTDNISLMNENASDSVRTNLKQDSLLITPIGICLNFYEASNNFIFVSFNGERIKLYDNSSLAIVDAAMHAKYPNEYLFPRRGKEINYKLNGVHKIKRGDVGEPAIISLNGEIVDINHSIKANDVIKVTDSTVGADAVLSLDSIIDKNACLNVMINKKKVMLPKMPLVNGEIKSSFYQVQDNDNISFLDYYTVKQIKEFMDIHYDTKDLVNNEEAYDNTKVYDNFSISFRKKNDNDLNDDNNEDYEENDDNEESLFQEETLENESADDSNIKEENINNNKREKNFDSNHINVADEKTTNPLATDSKNVISLNIIVNKKPVTLKGKASYIFVDVFDFIDFDTHKLNGTEIITTLNGNKADFTAPLKEGDLIEIYWI